MLASLNRTYDEKEHRYYAGASEYPSVTRICCRDANPFWTERSRQRGIAVHAANEMLLDNDLAEESLDPSVSPYVEAFRAFVRDCKPKVLLRETIVWSDKYKYAGRLDLYANVFGMNVLIDEKSGQMPAHVGMQLAAYNQAMWETTGDRADELRALQLRADGLYRLFKVGSESDNLARFLELRRQYDERASTCAGDGAGAGGQDAGAGAPGTDRDGPGYGVGGGQPEDGQGPPQGD